MPQPAHGHCGNGALAFLYLGTIVIFGAGAAVIAIVAGRWSRRRKPGMPIPLLAAEHLAQRAARTGVITLATCVVAASAAQAMDCTITAFVLGVVAFYGAIERVAAACVMRRLGHVGAVAELRGPTLVVTAATGRTWLEMSWRAIETTGAVPRAQNL